MDAPDDAPNAEQQRLKEAFRKWADSQNALLLGRRQIAVQGLETHRPGEHIQIGGDEFLVEFEIGRFSRYPVTRSRWSTFWAYASKTPDCYFMLVLPEACVSPEGKEISKEQLTASLHLLLKGIEAELAGRGIVVNRKMVKFVFV
jgi:hypothetical protein